MSYILTKKVIFYKLRFPVKTLASNFLTCLINQISFLQFFPIPFKFSFFTGDYSLPFFPWKGAFSPAVPGKK